jgi:60 kDa SS-A/Ro ribonucleoprotein
LGCDVSGSMSTNQAGKTPLSCCEAAGAMAMVALHTEPECVPMAFCNHFVPIKLTTKMRLDEVAKHMHDNNFGTTDCSQPMLWALQNKIKADVFVVYTDNETWDGSVHPCQALQQYRQKFGIPAKLIVVGMTATEFSIADPDDAGMLDVVGFDTSAPTVMADFVRE